MPIDARGDETLAVFAGTVINMSSIARAVTKTSMATNESDPKYWLSRPAEERLQFLVELRREYEGWTEETEPSLPRIVLIRRMRQDR